jgi:hypothetical protein
MNENFPIDEVDIIIRQLQTSGVDANMTVNITLPVRHLCLMLMCVGITLEHAEEYIQIAEEEGGFDAFQRFNKELVNVSENLKEIFRNIIGTAITSSVEKVLNNGG